MITVEEADGLIDLLGLSLKRVSVAFADAGGRVLACPIRADRDGPPFDRVAMDGIAVNLGNHGPGAGKWASEGLQAAGSPRMTLKDPAHCLEAMTGAPLPSGTDTVIPFEHLEKVEGVYGFKGESLKPGQNIHLQGSDYRFGQVLLDPPRLLRSPEMAVVASVGVATLEVYAPPKLALVTTGSELVDVDEIPLPHQIRKSNIHAARNALQRRGYDDLALTHLVDDEEGTRRGLERLMENHEVIVLSGGVSKGKLDFVPSALEACGIRKVFHGIAQKPGKPLWVGEGRGVLVFACPGNPVSMLVCLERYVLPFLDRCMGQKRPSFWLRSSRDIKAKPSITLFKAVRLETAVSGGTRVEEVEGNGSGDFFHLCAGDGFIEVPPSGQAWPQGTSFRFWPWS